MANFVETPRLSRTVLKETRAEGMIIRLIREVEVVSEGKETPSDPLFSATTATVLRTRRKKLHRTHWSEEEKAYLEELWVNHTTPQIARKMRRTAHAIQVMASRLRDEGRNLPIKHDMSHAQAGLARSKGKSSVAEVSKA